MTGIDERFRELEGNLKKSARGALRSFGVRGLRVNILLVGKLRMQALNSEFRGKLCPTNVLAFPVPDDFPVPPNAFRPIGDVYLCPPYIEEHGESLEYMLVHGMLHLLGFKHESKSDRMKMEKREAQVIAFLRERSE